MLKTTPTQLQKNFNSKSKSTRTKSPITQNIIKGLILKKYMRMTQL